MEHTDTGFMRQALSRARSVHRASPNPRVGAVVVRDGAVVGGGFHRGPGRDHAEAEALRGVDARGATLFVTLEPCTVDGLTPPCAPMVLESGVARVVVAMEDPDARVRGAGIAYLRDHGIAVDVGVCADEVRELTRAYIHHRLTGRPFVTVKLALSLDGKLAPAHGNARWITGAETRASVHLLRAEVDAVMVGAGTVAADDPQLTARDVGATSQPARVVLDASGRTDPAARVFDADASTIIVTSIDSPHEVQRAWKESGAEVLVMAAGSGLVDVDALLDDFGRRGFLHVLCEGGARVATTLLRDDLVDRMEVHYGPILLGSDGVGLGELGVNAMADATRWNLIDTRRSGDDIIAILERGHA